jgi:hypothetical protein
MDCLLVSRNNLLPSQAVVSAIRNLTLSSCFKVDSPAKVTDYMPISLLNTSIKILTKLLANKLQQVIVDLIHKNQYGFIKSRTIQDCLAWAFEYLHLCHKSGKELIILKLDFEKVFDRIEHQTMLQIMDFKGFSQQLLHWMASIFSSRTSAVLRCSWQNFSL